MARAFYASKISANIGRTPQDYLICHNVPISRTGVQDYYGEECGLEEYRGRTIRVNRAEADVFAPASIASFEGMPVTDGHPGEDVTAGNFREYIMGAVRNVRRGEGEDSDKAVADLIIYDQALADGIQGGKREISCGYSCVYETAADGTVYQKMIRGNHVAVVPAGRAGSEVAIRDSTPAPPSIQTVIKTERSNRKVKKAKDKASKGIIFSKLFPIVAKDADPGEVAEAMETIEEAISEAPSPLADEGPAETVEAPKDEKPEEMPPWAQAILTKLAQLEARAGARDEDPIEKLEDELSGGEEAVAIPPDQIDEDPEAASDNDPPPTADDETTGDGDIDPVQDEGPDAAAATDSLLKLVRAMKPVIAGIKDEKAKKRASDALTRSVRDLRGQRVKRGAHGYTAIMDAQRRNSRSRARDVEPGAFDFEKLQAAYDSVNPHKKERR